MAGAFGQAKLFFREKPVMALISLTDEKREWYASSLAKEIDCTFPHIIKILNHFNQLGFVYFKSKGRKKLVFLTSKGRQIAFGFAELVKAAKKAQ